MEIGSVLHLMHYRASCYRAVIDLFNNIKDISGMWRTNGSFAIDNNSHNRCGQITLDRTATVIVSGERTVKQRVMITRTIVSVVLLSQFPKCTFSHVTNVNSFHVRFIYC